LIKPGKARNWSWNKTKCLIDKTRR
jgi:hypothetical protein